MILMILGRRLFYPALQQGASSYISRGGCSLRDDCHGPEINEQSSARQIIGSSTGYVEFSDRDVEYSYCLRKRHPS